MLRSQSAHRALGLVSILVLASSAQARPAPQGAAPAQLSARAAGFELAPEPGTASAAHARPGQPLELGAAGLTGSTAVIRRGELGAGPLLAEFWAEYEWIGDGAPEVTARLELGVRTREHGRVVRAGRPAGPTWDKLLVYEPLLQAPAVGADGQWHVERLDLEHGRFWILDRVEQADSRSQPRTLASMATSREAVGTRTLAELAELVTAPDATLCELRLTTGEAPGRTRRETSGGRVHLRRLATSLLRGGATIGFAAPAGVTNLDTAELFTTIQAAIDDADTLDGHTLSVQPGTYVENLVLGKRLNLLGAQAGTSAVGRVSGAPDPLVESIVAPATGVGLTLVTGCADSSIDGFTFLGGSVGVDSATGPLDALLLRGNHFEGQTASNAVLDAFAVNMTVEQNAFLTTDATGVSVELGMGDCDGLHFTDNALIRSGAVVSKGLSSSGNNNLGASGLRPALISQNVVEGHGVGIDLGARSFVGGSIVQNELRYNGTGLGYGVQNALLASNVFAGNQVGLHLSSLGSASPLSGAFGDVVSGNQFLGSGMAAVRLDAGQAVGTIGTNTFDSNCFQGNALAIDYPGAEGIAAEDNWWGHASGPADPVGANPADNGACPPVPLVNAGGLGDAVTGDALDYCPWLEQAVCQTLALMASGCPDDAFPGEAGTQVAVELWMLDLGSEATGFQAFLSFDDAVMSYRGDLSTYTPAPFPLHVQALAGAEVAPGELRLDGSDAFGGGGASADALLATLIFDVVAECSVTTVEFDATQPFESTVSYAGYPLPTLLQDSPGFTLDDTPPAFDPYADLTVAADAAGGCSGAVVAYAAPTFTEGCAGPVVLDCVPPSGSFFPTGTTTVTCTATDACGNSSMTSFDVTVTATNLVDVEVDLVGVTLPVSRCIRFELDGCSAAVDVPLSFVAGSPSKAVATIEVPCGVYTSICAKDRQHTLWATSPLALSLDGTRYESSAVLALEGGDTDDDGDVDIDDVTWFLAQFGALASPGGCPWDGTRDADFSNNTAVGSEDYTFLVAGWLSTTGCSGCPLPTPPARASTPVRDPLSARADLNADGVVDHRDVALFEQATGLPAALSSRMRASETR